MEALSRRSANLCHRTLTPKEFSHFLDVNVPKTLPENDQKNSDFSIRIVVINECQQKFCSFRSSCIGQTWKNAAYPPSPLFHPIRPRGLTFTWWGCNGLCHRRKPTELAHSFSFCSCVYFYLTALSIVFHSINSPDNCPFSHSVLPVLTLLYWSFQLHISLWKSPSALI